MPNRILRADILTSDRVAKLSWQAEVFYRRLMSVVDDYGRFDGRTSVLRTYLYPIQIDKVSERDIGKWRLETVEAGLVTLYEVKGKEYVQIERFDQRTRTPSKYPSPVEARQSCAQDSADVGGVPQDSANDGLVVSGVGGACVVGVGDEGGVDFSAEPQKTAIQAPEHHVFRCRGDIPEWTIPESLLTGWKEIYPHLDIETEIKKSQLWLSVNEGSRKTAKGMAKFLNGWMDRAQNRPSQSRQGLFDLHGSAASESKADIRRREEAEARRKLEEWAREGES